MKTQHGFTITEVLIVITILTVIASLLVLTYSSSLKSARDTRRKSDLNQIAHELKGYYEEHGSYPTDLPNLGVSLPTDPRTKVSYVYQRNGSQTYMVYAQLESGDYFVITPDKQETTASMPVVPTVVPSFTPFPSPTL